MNIEFANKWTAALGEDVDAFAALYAETAVVEIGTYADNVGGSITKREDLRRSMAQFSNKDLDNGVGVHTFKARTYEGHERHGIIIWSWTGEGLKTYRGLPVDGRTLETVGQSFLTFDSAGKITRESTYWNDVKVLKVLGVPMNAAHYWKE